MSETKRRATIRDRILAALQLFGSEGMTNRQLNEIGFSYLGRLHELRQEYEIDTIRIKDGLFRYVLRGRRDREQTQQRLDFVAGSSAAAVFEDRAE